MTSIDETRYSMNCDWLSWEDAAEACARLGGSLATIGDAATDAALGAYKPAPGFGSAAGTGVWIGLSYQRSDDGDRWQWATGDALGYEGWRSGEPNDWGGVAEDCAVKWYDDQEDGWDDAPCGSLRPSLCELRGGSDPTDDGDGGECGDGRWAGSSVDYAAARPGAADCAGCGFAIGSYEACVAAAAAGADALGVGGLGGREDWGGPRGCHVQFLDEAEAAESGTRGNFQWNDGAAGGSSEGHAPVCVGPGAENQILNGGLSARSRSRVSRKLSRAQVDSRWTTPDDGGFHHESCFDDATPYGECAEPSEEVCLEKGHPEKGINVDDCVESQPIQDTCNLSVLERIFGGSLSL